ncbi:MAG: heavy metal translocating P-type ATPase, partial [Oscillospiraceae bacterium]
MKKTLIRILISAALFVGGLIVEHKFAEISLILLLASFLLAGGDVILNAFKNILRGKVFDENFLMSLATLGAIAIKQYPEAAAVMLFYQVGELFQSYAVDKSRKSIGELMDIRPDYANRKIGASIEKVDPEAIAIGDIIIVRAGEKIPLDGIVEDGSSMLDTSALTGESMPRKTEAGMEVLSGSINLNGLLTIRVTKKFSESTVSKILDLVENASNKKADSENFISKFAAVYTPVVVISAVLLAFVPPLIIEGAIFTDWLYRALTFLVVSCPCALVISIPLSFFGGIGGASRAGILVKGSNYLEAISKAEIVVFDKTGTLTEGVFAVREIFAANGNKDELLEFAAFAENQSNHPISLSLKKAYGKSIDNSLVTDINEISGYGVSAVVMGKNVVAGNSKLMARENIAFSKDDIDGTAVHVAVNGNYAGYIVISDKIKND